MRFRIGDVCIVTGDSAPSHHGIKAGTRVVVNYKYHSHEWGYSDGSGYEVMKVHDGGLSRVLYDVGEDDLKPEYEPVTDAEMNELYHSLGIQPSLLELQ